MSTVTKNFIATLTKFGGVPFGNMFSQTAHFETDASGIMVKDGAPDSDLATAVQSGDVVRIALLPAGLQLQDMQATISDAFTAATTASIGFLYADGVDVAAAPQDAAYFVSALATSATGVSRKTGVKAPLTLAKDAYLTLTIGGAAHASVGIMDVTVIGRDTGGN